MRQHDSNIGRLHAIGAAIFMLVVSAGAARAQVSLVGAGLAGTPDVPVNPCEGSDDPNDCIVPCVVRPNPYDTRGVTNTNIWPGGIVPYTFGDDATQQQRDFARAGMDVIESVANITFIPRTNEANYVRLIPDSGNWSYVGRIGGRQDLGLYNWSNQGIVIHELMHALGIHHEQSHAQRDTYVFINYPKIQPGRENNFALRASTPTVGPYDFESLMHYGPTGFSINGDRTIKVRPAHARAYQYVIGQRGAPSNGDIWTLVTMYGGNPPARNFTLSTPANSVAVGENWAPTFTWATSQNATSYNIKVDDDPFFGSPEINANTAGTVYSQATVLARAGCTTGPSRRATAWATASPSMKRPSRSTPGLRSRGGVCRCDSARGRRRHFLERLPRPSGRDGHRGGFPDRCRRSVSRTARTAPTAAHATAAHPSGWSRAPPCGAATPGAAPPTLTSTTRRSSSPSSAAT